MLDELPRGEDWTWPWGEVHELRHCVCGSTIHIVLASDPEARDSYRKLWATERMFEDDEPEEEEAAPASPRTISTIPPPP